MGSSVSTVSGLRIQQQGWYILGGSQFDLLLVDKVPVDL